MDNYQQLVDSLLFWKKITKFESSVKAFIHIEKHGVVDKNFKLFTKLSTKV
ncbi:MAG TPA: hypothetical protein IAA62_01665 [Candidatus Caccopulliclostridium gallistercoris]|uniref:Uncharacterized protein n=1 Tax=Candidatus Caccopulliclostridium gallistercoris TaxID=2840719 RepID=A0A9D1NDS0_9FIRM|nr:hypothetical protein [Candidatus Caccopulliclostridium gallistercoris]